MKLKPWKNPVRPGARLKRNGLYLGRDERSGEPYYLPLDALRTHLHLIGPPDVGKSQLQLWLFQNLVQLPGATVVLLNPKGELGRQARDWMIGAGLTRRLIWFAPGDGGPVMGWNPLGPNGLPVATQAKSVREAIRAVSGQSSFDETPQLARHLYLTLYVAREQRLTLVEAVQVLRAGSELRSGLLSAVQDPYVREALHYFDSLRESRQDELAASSLARLESLVMDPTIREVLTQQEHAIDFAGDLLGKHKVLIAELGLYRPLRADDVKALGRLLVNSLLGHVFERPPEKRSPVYLLLDEVQLFATADLCAALELGRELGFHVVLAHQHPSQLMKEDPSGDLWESVLGCARTKIVFGGMAVPHLEPIIRELFLEEYDPWEVKDEITTLECEPIETTREVVTQTKNRGWNRGTQKSRTWARSTGDAHGTSVSHGRSRSRGTARAMGLAFTQGRSRTLGSSASHGSVDSWGQSSGNQTVFGVGDTILPSGEVIVSDHSATGMSAADFSGGASVETSGESESRTSHKSRGVQFSRAAQRSRTEQRTYGSQRSVSEATTLGGQVGTNSGVSGGEATSRSRVPFHAYRKRRVVSSRTFLSEAESLTLKLQEVKGQPKAHFVVKTPGAAACFLQAPYVREVIVPKRLTARALDRVYGASYYATPETIQAEEAARTARLRELTGKDSAAPDLDSEDFFTPIDEKTENP